MNYRRWACFELPKFIQGGVERSPLRPLAPLLDMQGEYEEVLQGWGWFLQKLCQRHGKYLLVGAQYFVGAVIEGTDFSDESQSGFVVGSQLV